MKNIRRIFSMSLAAGILTVSLVVPGIAAESNLLPGKAAYDPTKEYQGPYETDNLYLKYPKSFWQRGMDGTFPSAVSCRTALTSLRQTGRWKGNFGPGGSCGTPGEPTDWALGNRLNYEAQFETD